MGSALYMSLFIGPMVPVPAPKVLIDALTSVEVTVAAGKASGFQLKFTLADRSPLQTLFLLAGDSPVPFLRVVVMVAAGGLPQVLMDGVMQHHEVVPDAMTGSAALNITGTDLTAMMGLVDFSGLQFPGMPPEGRVTTILSKYAVLGIIPQVSSTFAPDVPVPTNRIPSQKGTDLAYIEQLAQEVGYVFYLEPGPAPGTSTAYWGPEVRIGVPQPALNVNQDAWTNVESLNFKYEPQSSVLPVVYLQDEITKQVVPVGIPAANPLSPAMGAVVPVPQKLEYLKDTAKLSPSQALMLGIARATATGDVVSGDGTLDVLRYGSILKARQLVGVRGAGLAFDGVHYVSSTTHRLERGQFKTSFQLKRNALISNTPVVPTAPF